MPRAAIRPSAWSDAIDVLPGSSDLQDHEDGKSKRLRKAIAAVEQDYEAVLIDCPPSLGNLTRSALTAARHSLIVVEPSALGLRGIGGVADLVDDVWDTSNPDLELAGVVLNRVPAVSAEADRRIAELARIVGHEAIWSPAVPQRVIFNQAIGERRPIHSYTAPRHRADRGLRRPLAQGQIPDVAPGTRTTRIHRRDAGRRRARTSAPARPSTRRFRPSPSSSARQP